MEIISNEYKDPLKFCAAYSGNAPFPHIVFDSFIKPDIIRAVFKEFPDLSKAEDKIEFSSQKEIKFASRGSSGLSPAALGLVNRLNSDDFLEYLQKLTGIQEPLISDPYLSGGGYHQIKRGGWLKVHADFNKHPRLDLDRRINLLLYLNPDWESIWGGNLELYDQNNLSEPVVSIEPKYNRCVIFNTTSFTFHGHPDALECPDDRSRKSIALYYFSTGRPDAEVNTDKHKTLFVGAKGEVFRPGIGDVIRDWTPPILLRGLKSLLGRH